MQQVSPLIKQIAQLIDARHKTLEVNLKAEIRSTESRLTKRLDSVENRMSSVEKKLNGVDKKLGSVEDKLEVNINNHDQRIKKLERQAAIAA